jgi:hypothetical protein
VKLSLDDTADTVLTASSYTSCNDLALTAAIWHNDHKRQPVLRSLTAYDH